jgi:hypothetical protein
VLPGNLNPLAIKRKELSGRNDGDRSKIMLNKSSRNKLEKQLRKLYRRLNDAAKCQELAEEICNEWAQDDDGPAAPEKQLLRRGWRDDWKHDRRVYAAWFCDISRKQKKIRPNTAPNPDYSRRTTKTASVCV